MTFHPFPIIDFSTIFLVKPPDKPTCTEPRGIGSKIMLNAFQGETANRDQLGQQISHRWVCKIARDAVKMCGCVYVLLGFGFTQITDETPR
jgi:hypothetical protein